MNFYNFICIKVKKMVWVNGTSDEQNMWVKCIFLITSATETYAILY